MEVFAKLIVFGAISFSVYYIISHYTKTSVQVKKTLYDKYRYNIENNKFKPKVDENA
jgi:hypothetical protein